MMKNSHIYIEKVRYSLVMDNHLIVRMGYTNDLSEGYGVELCLDGLPLSFILSQNKGIEVRRRYLRYMANISEEFIYDVALPPDYDHHRQFEIYSLKDGEKQCVYTLPISRLKKSNKQVYYGIDNVEITGDYLSVRGWAVPSAQVRMKVLDSNGKPVNIENTKEVRSDLIIAFPECGQGEVYGFNLSMAPEWKDKASLVFTNRGYKETWKITDKIGESNGLGRVVRFGYKVMDYYQRVGFKSSVKRALKMIKGQEKAQYMDWMKKHQVTAAMVETQRKTEFDLNPCFSIVVPLFKTPEVYLRALLDSVQAQSYGNWELCLADGSPDDSLKPIIEGYGEPRFKYKKLSENLGISDNTNQAIAMAMGDYIVMGDHDDTLTVDALFECAKAINTYPMTDVLYSDEDKMDMKGKKYFEPHFKPDFNIDLLRSVNYVCHLFVVKKTLLDKVGAFDKNFDGAQDHDFILRCTEQAAYIHHIPKVLYHWRCHVNSTSANPESKTYAFDAGKRAVLAHYNRVGIKAEVTHGISYGIYHTLYQWEEKPLVSILIPNKDHIEDLQKCINSIEEKCTYDNYEYIIIENNSTEPETFAYYEKLKAENLRVTVVQYEGSFNYSAINNFGAGFAKGDYYLLLNNDVEVINGDFLEEMLAFGLREDVGIVGAKLLYPDDTIQHAGVVVGIGGIAGAVFVGLSRYEHGYFSRENCAQDYSAVTAACMLVRRSVFEAVNGLTTELAVAFNDIDFCLKVRQLGKKVVYTPYAQLYHYESKSRGLENTPEKVERFNGEIAIFAERWPEILRDGDPYYNPNLTLERSDFTLKM